MIWKTRTRSKIMIIALLFVAAWASVVVIAWATKPKHDGPAMLGVVLGSAMLALLNFLWSIVKENGQQGRTGRQSPPAKDRQEPIKADPVDPDPANGKEVDKS